MNSRPSSSRLDVLIGTLLLISFASGYVLFAASARHQHWDSLSYSHAAETQGVVIWGNHPLGHLLLTPAFLTARRLGYDGTAMAFFQVANGFISGSVVALFFGILVTHVGLSTLSALGVTLILGGANAFWHFAGTADIYSIALFFSLLSWWALIRKPRTKGRGFDVLQAVLLALATLAHQLNAAIIVSAAYQSFRSGQDWKSTQKTLVFLFVTGLGILLGYALIGFIATSSTSFSEVIAWARGYVGDARWGGKISLDALGAGWTAATGVMLWPVSGTGLEHLLRRTLIAALLLAPLTGVLRYAQWGPQRRVLFEAALLQCAVSLCLIVWWEPRHSRFWLLILVPYAIVIACSWGETRNPGIGESRRWKRWSREAAQQLAVVFLGVAVLGFNLRFGIVGESRPDERLEAALESWVLHSEPGDALIPTDELIPHLLFRAGRPQTLNLDALLVPDPNSTDVFGRLRTAIAAAQCDGRRVLVATGAGAGILEWRSDVIPVSPAQLDAFFAQLDRSEVFRYTHPMDGNTVIVHHLAPSNEAGCQP